MNIFFILALIPLILSIGMTPSLSFVELFSDAHAAKGQGVSTSKYGSSTNICGLQLCSDYPGGKEAWKAAQGKTSKTIPDEAEQVFCIDLWEPVCGIDGQTYSNQCFLDAKGVELSHEGECSSKTGEIDFSKESQFKTLPEGGKHALTATPVIENPKSYPEFFIPNEEILADDEMRVTFCGTSMPLPTISQSSPCVLVELGNGDKFIFDIGGGSLSRLGALQVPFDELNKIFVGHLHTDHVGDLDMLWAAGVPFGRVVPIELYGPNGADHSMGTASFVENLLEAYKWDFENRRGKAVTSGAAINVHEFDWTQTQVVYDQNGVQIIAFPAIHGLDGAVSYRLDWNGLSFAFSSDTKPNQFYVENTQDVDISIHETFLSADQLVELWGMNPSVAKTIAEAIHTPPSWAGVVFELTQPRVAVGYHTYVTPETVPLHFEDVRTTYKGPYVLAQDLTTFNITPEGIVVRQAIVDLDYMPKVPKENADVPLDEPQYFMSDWVLDSALDMDALLDELKK
jgi:ribonuclease Z